MKLRRDKSYIKSLETERKGGVPWGKYIYLFTLVVILFAFFLWGKNRALYIEAPALLQGHTVDIGPRIKTRVKKVNLDIGDYAHIGQELVVLERGEFEDGDVINLSLRKSSIEQEIERLCGELSELSYESSSLYVRIDELAQEVKNANRLLNLGAITRSRYLALKFEYEDAKSRLRGIETRIKARKKQISALEDQLVEVNTLLASRVLSIDPTEERATYRNNSTMKENFSSLTLSSPVEGRVLQIVKNKGEIVLPGETVIRVVDLSNLFLKAFFDPDKQSYLKVGKKVEVVFENGIESSGFISKIYPSATPLSSEFPQRIDSIKRVLVVEIHRTKDSNEWPSILGMGAQVRIPRLTI